MSIELSPNSPIWIRCDACHRIAGMNVIRPEWDRVLLASAGAVTQIRAGQIFVCASPRSRSSVVYEHPIACSDDCERQILQMARLPTDRVGLEDADLLDLAAVAEEAEFLAEVGDDDGGRIQLLLLKRDGLPLKRCSVVRPEVTP